MTPRRKVRRARARGFSHVSTTLEAAAVLAWFAVAVAAEKRLDDAITARRAVEAAAQNSAHASAAACTSVPLAPALGEVRASAGVRIEDGEKLGIADSALPHVQSLGVPAGVAFPSQQAPLRQVTATGRYGATAEGTTGGFAAQRRLPCQDVVPASPAPRVAPLRAALWERNVKGYR